jgi:hypothetical protein
MSKVYATQIKPLAFDWATGDKDIGTVLRYDGQTSTFKIIFIFVASAET